MKMKLDPTPGVLSTQILPPIISTRRLLIVSPRPVPPNLRVILVSAWVNGRNSLSISFCDIPMPVSFTEKRKMTPSLISLASVTLTITSPCWVNLTALPARLISTWLSRSGSPISWLGTSEAVCIRNSTFFSWALLPTIVAKLPMTSSRLKFVRSISIFPASIFETSRMSLIIPSSDFAEPFIFCR